MLRIMKYSIFILLLMPLNSSAKEMILEKTWGFTLDLDVNNPSNDDLLAHYPKASTSFPSSSTFMDYSIKGRYHFSNALYSGLELDSLHKTYELKIGNGFAKETFDWNALYPSILMGWSFFRGENSWLGVEASAGYITLYQSRYIYEGPTPSKGKFEGSAFSGTLGLSGTWALLPAIGVDIMGGYRLARINNVQAPFDDGSGQKLNYDGSQPFIDFSGLIARVGLSFNWGMPDPWGENEALQTNAQP
jgi:hypothetical protein